MTMQDTAIPARIGFLGTGRMGHAMISRLLESGVDVVVWNRSRESMEPLIEAGATEASTPSDALATGHVFSMLANDQAVREVFTSEALQLAPPGTIHVNHATISPEAAAEFAALHDRLGHVYVSAPVVGRPDVADRGMLTILAAGDADAIQRSTPLLDVMGKKVWNHGSDPVKANVAKIAVNYLIIHALQGLAESVTLLERHGLDADVFIDAINDSVFPGPVYTGYGHGIASRTYLPAGFTTTLGQKDLLLALEVARGSGTELPTAAVLRSIFEDRIAAGHPDDDWSSIAEVTRQRSTADGAAR